MTQYIIAGVIPGPQDTRDYVLGSLAADGVAAPFQWDLSSLPRDFDLKQFEDFVKNQNAYGACVGHGIASGFELFLGLRGQPLVLSPMFSYFIGRDWLDSLFNRPTQDSGCSVFGAMAAHTRHGTCLESAWPYTSPVNDRPSAAAYADAEPRKMRRYERVGRNSFNRETGESIQRNLAADLKMALYHGCPVVFGIPVTQAISDITGPLETHPGQGGFCAINDTATIGTHCMAVIGWRTRADGQTVFIVENSWGPEWGDGGFLGILARDLESYAFDLFAPRAIAGVESSIPMKFYRWTGVHGQAARLYRAALGRYPDAEGLAYQTNAVQTLGLVAVAGNFIASPEFQANYGALSDRQFVEQLYRNVLKREGESAGIEYHVDSLKTLTRADVLVGFSESPENQAA